MFSVRCEEMRKRKREVQRLECLGRRFRVDQKGVRTVGHEILQLCYLVVIKYVVVCAVAVDDVGGEIFPWDARWTPSAFEEKNFSNHILHFTTRENKRSIRVSAWAEVAAILILCFAASN
jgi:hypothetical protein